MKFPNWPNPIGYRNIELGLGRVYELLARLNNPHQFLPPTIHVAGTNGKGSTIACLNSILSDDGYKVHVYTSPHLVEFNERIILAGKEISDEYLNEILQRCKEAAEKSPKINVTFFEAVTVAAFLAFSKIKADVLLLETGMGGRLDATNVVANPLATIITSISLDHTEFLGKTLAKIAFEKAGIIKKDSLVITANQTRSALEVIKNQATICGSPIYVSGKNFHVTKENGSMLFKMGNIKLVLPLPSLAGNHQIENAGNAIATLLLQKQFKIDKKNIAAGLVNARWKARIEKITSGKFFDLLPKNYQLFLDGSHNEGSAKQLGKWLHEDRKYKNYLICAMLENKDTEKFLKYFSNRISYLVGMEIAGESKSKSANQIVNYAEKLNIKSASTENFKQAIEKIIKFHNSNKPARIVICGSLYFAGEFLEKNNS